MNVKVQMAIVAPNQHVLYWVVKGAHLGHELHQSCAMDYDAKCKRGAFIDRHTDIREMFPFVNPGQLLEAVSVYFSHLYGSMLCDMYSESAGQVYRSWNTCVKLSLVISRITHNFFKKEGAQDLGQLGWERNRQCEWQEIVQLDGGVPTIDPWTHGAGYFRT